MNTANQMLTLTKGRWEQLIELWEEQKYNFEDSPEEKENRLAMEMGSIEMYIYETATEEMITLGVTPELNSFIVNYILHFFNQTYKK